MSELINSWHFCPLDQPPFYLPADESQLADLGHSVVYDTYEEFAQSPDFGNPGSKFHLGPIPQPYIGNIANATVYLLMLNPGLSAGDYYAQQHCLAFKTARERNLKQENGADEYPFFYLDPAFAWTAGGQWWQNKLRSLTDKLMGELPVLTRQRQAALSYLSRQVACLELCPYFSKEYKSPRMALSSVELMKRYAQAEVLKKCRDGRAIAISMRQVSIWGLPKDEPNILCFNPTQARGAHLTSNTEAGEKIYTKFRELGFV